MRTIYLLLFSGHRYLLGLWKTMMESLPNISDRDYEILKKWEISCRSQVGNLFADQTNENMQYGLTIA